MLNNIQKLEEDIRMHKQEGKGSLEIIPATGALGKLLYKCKWIPLFCRRKLIKLEPEAFYLLRLLVTGTKKESRARVFRDFGDEVAVLADIVLWREDVRGQKEKEDDPAREAYAKKLVKEAREMIALHSP